MSWTVNDVWLFQGGRPLYLQLDVARALTASAIVSILDANRWYHVSIISEDTYADDGFVDAFYALTTAASRRRRKDSGDGGGGNWTSGGDWSIEDYISVSRRSTRDEVDRQLLVLLENKSRVIVLHSRCVMQRHQTTRELPGRGPIELKQIKLGL